MTGADEKIDRNRHSRMAGRIRLSVRVLRPLLLYLEARGHDSAVFLKAQGLDPAIFRDAEARVPHAAAVSLWPAAARLSNDMNLGLHVAEAIRPGSFGGIGIRRTNERHVGNGIAAPLPIPLSDA